jgi:palmitoyl transferase
MVFASLWRRVALCAAMLVPAAAHAADGSANAASPAPESRWVEFQKTIDSTWHSDRYELYVPLNVWHRPSAYTPQKIDSFNEHPWGLGIGKYRYDAGHDWHALYAMAFLDSHNDIEPIVGYAFQKIGRPAGALRLGAGFTLGVTARADYRYIPFPVLLPLASLEYGRLAIQATYIPGGNGNGNVLFTWLRWQI